MFMNDNDNDNDLDEIIDVFFSNVSGKMLKAIYKTYPKCRTHIIKLITKYVIKLTETFIKNIDEEQQLTENDYRQIGNIVIQMEINNMSVGAK